MKIFSITDKDLLTIKSFAHIRFLSEDMGSLGTKELQAFLVIKGLEDFLRSKGIEPNFTLEKSITKRK